MTTTWWRGWASGLVLAVLAGAAAGPLPARADGDQSQTLPRVGTDPEYTAAVSAIKGQQFRAAIVLLGRVVARDARNADAHNWLGYAVRRAGDPRRAIPIYEKALALDPRHRGAHEYIGEAYLMVGNLGKAREHLTRVSALCAASCSEYTDLKQAVELYEQRGRTSTTR